MKIKKDIYYLSGGLFGQLGNVYAMKHEEGYVLFDCGNPNAYETIVENLEYWDIPLTQITHVFLTHGHDDHAGCAARLQTETGAQIVVGQGDGFMLTQGNFGKESPFLNHQMPKCNPNQCIEEDCTLHIGGLIIHIYTMPGHSNGYLLYYVEGKEERILFSGDMFYCEGEKGDIALTGWKGDMNYNSEKLGQSFKKLWNLQLQPTIVLGGHGNPRIGKDAKEQIMLAYKYYLLNNR